MTGEDVISNAFERHAQTALVLLLVALLLWVGSTTQTTAVSIAEMRIEIAYLKVSSDTPHLHPSISREVLDIQHRLDLLETQVREEL